MRQRAAGSRSIFRSPVAITAGTTYVASYHTSGNYSATSNYFTTAHTNGELTAPRQWWRGVYAYGTGSIFPTNSFNASNYWVDVVFNGSSSQPPVANNDSGFVDTDEHHAFDSGFDAARQRHGPQRAAAVDLRREQPEQRHGQL